VMTRGAKTAGSVLEGVGLKFVVACPLTQACSRTTSISSIFPGIVVRLLCRRKLDVPWGRWLLDRVREAARHPCQRWDDDLADHAV
jgi:hypothetical protein